MYALAGERESAVAHQLEGAKNAASLPSYVRLGGSRNTELPSENTVAPAEQVRGTTEQDEAQSSRSLVSSAEHTNCQKQLSAPAGRSAHTIGRSRRRDAAHGEIQSAIRT